MDNINILEIIDMERTIRNVVITFFLWFAVLASVFIDMWDGIRTAKALRQRISSHGLRKTITKYGDYWRILLFGFLFDAVGGLFSWYIAPYASIVITVGVVLIEFRSVLEHSRKRKSEIANLPEIIKSIISCNSPEEASRLLNTLKDEKDSTKAR